MSHIPPATTLSLDDLLREEQWLSGFVRRLVGPEDAEDVIQDTWVAALQRPPRSQGAARNWLGKVANNFVRQKMRRRQVQRRGEALAAKTETVPSTAATVERLATVAELVNAVMALREPYRTAVLLRHYHGLDTREVARRTSASEATVRQRLKRGLDQVRRDLHQRHGSDWRGALQALFVSGVSPSTVTTGLAPFALGVFIMSKQLIIGSIAALALLGLALSVFLSDDAPKTLQAAVEGDLAADFREASSISDLSESRSIQREDVEPAETAAIVQAAGRVLDVRGLPLGGVRLLARGSGEVVAESDHNGRFEFIASDLARSPRLDERYVTIRDQPVQLRKATVDLLYVVAPRVQVSGIVVDSSGRALSDVSITVEVDPLIDFPEPLDHLRKYDFADAKVDELGQFDMRDLPGGVARLRFDRAGYRRQYYELPTHLIEAAQIVLQPMEGELSTLVGRVLAEGVAIPDATIGLGERRVHSDQYGAYCIDFDATGLAPGTTLYAAKTGYQTRLISDFEAPDSPGRIERDIHIRGKTLSISGVVLGRDGQLLSDAAVMLWEEQPIVGSTFAEELSMDESAAALPFYGKPRAAGLSDAEGRFTVPGLRDRDYRLRVFHFDQLALTSVPIAAGSTGVELRYPADNSRQVSGRVIALDGEPLRDIKVRLNVCLHRSSLATSWQWGSNYAITDSAGNFVLEDVPADEDIVIACNDDNIITPMRRLSPQESVDIEIIVERRCHFRVESAFGDAVISLRDARGEPVSISDYLPNGGNNSYGEFNLLRGKTPVLVASERATSLVVSGDAVERVLPIRLLAGEVTVVRL